MAKTLFTVLARTPLSSLATGLSGKSIVGPLQSLQKGHPTRLDVCAAGNSRRHAGGRPQRKKWAGV
ncbi:MAG: hypothetical protein ABIN08_06240 [Caldimonas sp.]